MGKKFIIGNFLLATGDLSLCEFNVILNGKTVFKDVVYAKMDGNKIIVKDVLGKAKEFENCKIMEVDVNSTRMVLSSSKI